MRPSITRSIAFAALTTLFVGVAEAPSVAGTGGEIHGVVSHPATDWSGSIEARLDIFSPSSGIRTAAVASDGSYSFTSVAPGTYRLRFVYNGTGNFLSQGWGASPGSPIGAAFVVDDGSSIEANGALQVGSVIHGVVSTSNGAPLVNLQVGASYFDGSGTVSFQAVVDQLTGTYEINRLPPKTYRVRFVDHSSGPWRDEWWDDSRSLSASTSIPLGLEATFTANAVLDAYAAIPGSVVRRTSDGSLVPVSGVTIEAWEASQETLVAGTRIAAAMTDANGAFRLEGLPAAGVRIRATPHLGDGLATEWWGDSATRSGGSVLDVIEGEEMGPISLELGPAATVQGSFVFVSSTGEVPVASTAVIALAETGDTGEFEEVGRGFAWGDGSYTIPGLHPGRYVLDSAPPPNSQAAASYWGGRTLDEAIRFELAGGQQSTGHDFRVGLASPETQRLWGESRFETTVAVSGAAFPTVPSEGVPIVYIASAADFPDALVAGPAAAASGGVVLLVESNRIPVVVQDELRRLRPRQIVVVGGLGVVGAGVAARLQSFVPSPADVVRLGGQDRYETAEMIVRHVFEDSGLDQVFLATGANYPDALAAGPAASGRGAAVMLVDGGHDASPQLLEMLDDLGVESTVLVGGYGSLTSLFETSLNEVGISTGIRYAGADRIETATYMNESNFDDTDIAYIATAAGFADALAGGPLAARNGAPLYLSGPHCVPAGVLAALRSSDVRRVILLGGSGVLSARVESLQGC